MIQARLSTGSST